MGENEEVVLISALEHWSYCPRQRAGPCRTDMKRNRIAWEAIVNA
jgi:hypothetical protein